MNFASFRRRLFQNALDTDHLVASLARWPNWLLSCMTGRRAIARFKTGGIKMNLIPKLTSFGMTSIYIKRDYYEPELLAVERFIKKDSALLDIGGSFGIFTLFMANFVGPKGRVYTFEPGKLSFEELSRNVALNPHLSDRIRIFNVAAADRPDTLRLYRIGGAPVTASMGGAEGTPYDEVPAERISTLVPKEDHARVSFIKIDVEGFEKTALEGAREIIEASRPAIMFEISESALKRSGMTPQDMFDYLGSYGYSFFLLAGKNGLRRLDRPEDGNIFALQDQSPAA